LSYLLASPLIDVFENPRLFFNEAPGEMVDSLLEQVFSD
jgi:hypothetical protein